MKAKAVRGKMKFFKKSDIIVVIFLILVSAAVLVGYNLISGDVAAKAEIYYNSKLVKAVDLTAGEEKIFSIPQEPNVVFELDKEGNIRFVSSDCPDKICVNTGKIHIVGQSAACLPNGIVVKIVPVGERRDDEIDAVG